jgi:ubiquinone biosynthesis protein
MVSIPKAVRSTERLAKISLILAKHGFGEVLSRLPILFKAPPAEKPMRAFAIRLREALQELGPSFVKLGQVMSTRPDVLPADVVAELQKLQDSVPPMSADEVEEILAEAYGGELDTVFSEFDRTPLAAASIGQVHVARLRAGDVDVVVKLQRPHARTTVERDLDLLYLFARLVAEYIPETRIYAPVAMVEEFDRAITAELDYGREAENAIRFARNFEHDPTVRFPAPHREASGKRTLVMERFHGASLDKFVAAGGEGTGPRIAKQALRVVAKMVFEDGFFHADPHPGNIIMLGTPEEPVIGLIDLGLVGRLSEDMRDKAIGLVLAAATGDTAGLADSLLTVGRPKGRVDMPKFREEVSRISEKYLGRPLAEIEVSGLIRDLVQGALKFEIEIPSELIMMGKALMTIEGIGKQLDPQLDIWAELKPLLGQLMMNRLSPQRLGRDLLRAVRQLGTAATSLPGQVHGILEDLRAGRLELVQRNPDVARATERLGRRIYYGLVVATLLGAGTALLVADRHATIAIALIVTSFVTGMFHLWRERK